VPFAELADAAAAEVGASGGSVVGAVAEMPPYPEVLPALTALRDAGVRAATLSNGSGGTAEAVLARADASDLVEATLAAHDFGAWKPAAAAYLGACAALRVEPSRTALVAVHPWDVDGACRARLLGAWVDRGGRPYPAVMAPPVVTGPSLGEVVAGLV
jgi:2-haloacid dehalogenase